MQNRRPHQRRPYRARRLAVPPVGLRVVCRLAGTSSLFLLCDRMEEGGPLLSRPHSLARVMTPPVHHPRSLTLYTRILQQSCHANTGTIGHTAHIAMTVCPESRGFGQSQRQGITPYLTITIIQGRMITGRFGIVSRTCHISRQIVILRWMMLSRSSRHRCRSGRPACRSRPGESVRSGVCKCPS